MWGAAPSAQLPPRAPQVRTEALAARDLVDEPAQQVVQQRRVLRPVGSGIGARALH